MQQFGHADAAFVLAEGVTDLGRVDQTALEAGRCLQRIAYALEIFCLVHAVGVGGVLDGLPDIFAEWPLLVGTVLCLYPRLNAAGGGEHGL